VARTSGSPVRESVWGTRHEEDLVYYIASLTAEQKKSSNQISTILGNITDCFFIINFYCILL
jgi:hypothetical protein